MRKLAFWLTIALIFTVPWEAGFQIGPIGRGSRALGLIAAAVWGVSVVVRGRIRYPSALVKAYFVFLIWNGLTLYWSIDTDSTFRGFLTYTQIFVMILIFWDLFETEHQIETALQAVVAGAYVSCISILANYVTAPPTRFPEYQRIKALGFEVDGIALIVALAVPAAWYLATAPTVRRRMPMWRAINFAYVPVAFFTIILTGTRGAALASIPSAIFILWTLRNASPAQRYTAWLVVAAAVVVVLWIAPRDPLDRISGSLVDIANQGSLSGRREIWADGLQNFFDNPLVGVGLDSHRAASAFGKEAHNTPLSVLVETGLIGFILWSYAVVIVIGRTWQRVGWAAWYWRSQLAVAALGSLSLSLEDSKSIWIIVSLCVASAAAAQRTRSVSEPSPPQPHAAGVPAFTDTS